MEGSRLQGLASLNLRIAPARDVGGLANAMRYDFDAGDFGARELCGKDLEREILLRVSIQAM